MSIHDVLVCVGGPVDGQRLRIPRESPRIIFADEEPITSRRAGGASVPARTAVLAVYERRALAGEHGTVQVLAPENQLQEETMRLLTEGYRRT